ncbi:MULTISPECIES: ribosomal protection-like ABC-F family protein [unclassified Streptomyces]|uniref:ribosomal protection-like ABC-F family protein n=1 Tax=unclassified Streptomyces TaxID=2593676 RepID=UPI00081F1EB9|nr:MULTISPECIES: ABC-F family ATP-binding cassette domain-containing protein [unclassified Streptomyces]MYZ37215.1 ATP-binding cassette domain-containing protein [Streptomyces sp. SID4917]SCF89651.1 macrolide transport system ATP-binding/permease protein [Streptomyces sp. MnatMP-M17]
MRERAQLAMKDVSKAYGDRSVLDQVSLTVRPGEKAGVIGENGSGKSTLLRLLAGTERPDGGEITVGFPGGVGHLAQTPELDPRCTVQDAVDSALAELRALERRLREAEEALGESGENGLAAYGELLTAYEERGGYQADARVDAALHGLGLARVTRGRRLGSLSGGEQSRLALACVLASAPELLLLDEPTNHLDLQATGWLEEQLRAHRGTVVAVTHDRAFLDRIATTILEVDRDTRSVTRYGNGWQGYRTAKAAARQRWRQEHLEWLAEVARTEELVTAAGQRLAATGKDPRQGFGKHRRSHEAKLSGQVRAARQRLWRLRQKPVPAPPEPLGFTATLNSGAAPGPTAVAESPAGTESPADVRNVVAELADIVVGDRLQVAGLCVRAGERLLVTGPNGAGKSTLLRVLAGELRPDSGSVSRTARTGYLAQELPAVPSRLPLLRAFAAGRPGLPEEYEAELLGLGLFRAEDLAVPVAALSVGQRRRLELARLVSRPTELLILDEPTNHLALALVEELEEALRSYAGAVVVVSHDRRFRAGFTGTRLELRSGRVVRAVRAEQEATPL